MVQLRSLCSSIKRLHSVPLTLVSRCFYFQSRFFGTHAWKSIWFVVSVSSVLAIYLAFTWTDRNGASGSSQETEDMFSISGGKYSEWIKQYRDAFNFTIDNESDYWAHHSGKHAPLSVVLLPKETAKISVNSSLFWADMQFLCDVVHSGTSRVDILNLHLKKSLWKNRVCGKKNGSCYEPWVCNRHRSIVDNYDSTMQHFKQNTRIANPEFVEVAERETKEGSKHRIVSVVSADALLAIWHPYPDDAGFFWNYKTYKELLKVRDTFNCCRVFVYSDVALMDSMDSALSSQTPIFCATVALILIFTIAVNWKYSLVHSRSSLAIAVILCTFMAIGNGLAVGKLLGIPHIALVTLTPFIVLGVGIDSGLILIRAWARECIYIEDPVERTSRSIEKTFSSIFMSDFTSLLAFTIGSFTKYPAVNFACQYLALQILCLFVVECTFLTSCLVLHNRRVNSSNHCLCCWDKVDEGEENFLIPCYPKFNVANATDNSFEKDAQKVYGFVVRKRWTRILILLFTTLLVLVAVRNLVKMQTSYDPSFSVQIGSQLEDFFQIDEQISRPALEVAITVENPVEYWNRSIGKNLQNLHLEFLELDFCDQSMATFEYSWIEPFYKLYFSTDEFSRESFYNVIAAFLTRYPVFKKDLVLGSLTDDDASLERVILKSRFIFPMVHLNGMMNPREAKRRFELMENLIANYSDFNIHICLQDFSSWEAMVEVKHSTLKTIITALLICCITVLVLIPEVTVFLAVVATTGLAIICTLGFMTFFGLCFNMLTYTQITIGIGLSIDYMSHSGYSFAVESGNALERSEKSLATMGVALTNATLSSLLGVSLLSLSTTHVFRSFFISFSILFSLSFYFGVIFLPVILSLIASPKHQTDFFPRSTLMSSWSDDEVEGDKDLENKQRRKNWTRKDDSQAEIDRQNLLSDDSTEEL